MRYPAEHKQRTRERIVKAAARRFRTRGTGGAGIATLMRDLRLTHGGFYRHFSSKEALIAEAFELALTDVRERFAPAVRQAPKGGELKALIDTYLSLEHCNSPAEGCPVATLAAEIARRPRPVREALLTAIRNHFRHLTLFFPGPTDEARLRQALLLFSGMAGTLTLARAVTDEEERRGILDEARAFYLHAAAG